MLHARRLPSAAAAPAAAAAAAGPLGVDGAYVRKPADSTVVLVCARGKIIRWVERWRPLGAVDACIRKLAESTMLLVFGSQVTSHDYMEPVDEPICALL